MPLDTRCVQRERSQQKKANAAPKKCRRGPPRRVYLRLDADVPPANLQVSLALLVAGDTDQAVRAVSALAALYKRADHAECMERMIGAPSVSPAAAAKCIIPFLQLKTYFVAPSAAAKGEGYSNFTAAPVRFEASSGNRTDPWAHMQLDALGLFLIAYGSLGARRLLTPDAALIGRFLRYLWAIQYWTRADLGHWEEWPALVRSSSLGCVVAGVRAAAALLPAAESEELQADALAARGREVLDQRLGDDSGGAWEAEGRREDAALLTLLLPPVAAALDLTPRQHAALASTALRLRRSHGVLRYVGDSYYGADYQARLGRWKAANGCGDPGAYPLPDERNSWAVPACEAEWTIFEPLLLLHFLWAHRRERSEESGAAVRRCLMRILAAIEEGPPGSGPSGGSDVRLHVHESYAVVGGVRRPNDVQDLLWAVAYVRMALAALEQALREGEPGSFIRVKSRGTFDVPGSGASSPG